MFLARNFDPLELEFWSCIEYRNEKLVSETLQRTSYLGRSVYTCLCKSPENSDFIFFSYDRDKKNLLLIKTKVEIRNNLVVLEGCVFHVCLYIFYFVYLMRTMPFNLICGVITDIEHRM